jgi:hypothetical protein
MHPLQVSLDTSQHDFGHEAAAKRRMSLDNSCLSAHESLRILLQWQNNNHDPDDYCYDDTNRNNSIIHHKNNNNNNSHRQPRRYSLTHKIHTTATFLAGTAPPPKKGDLDLDCHSSTHTKTNVDNHHHHSSSKVHSLLLESSHDTSCDDDSEELSETDLFDNHSDSDCDSFCNASFQEPANKEYLMTDLGASCFWGGDASLSDLRFQELNVHHGDDDDDDDNDGINNNGDINKNKNSTTTTSCGGGGGVLLLRVIEEDHSHTSSIAASATPPRSANQRIRAPPMKKPLIKRVPPRCQRALG